MSPGPRIRAAASRVADACGDAAISDLFGDRDDEQLLTMMADASAARDAVEVVLAAAAAEVARRSARELGYAGLAQRKGHRNVTSLVQNITGQTKADVGRAIRAGEELAPATVPVSTVTAEPPVAPTWQTTLRDAFATGRITQAQFSALRTGLGEPPLERYPDLAPDFLLRAWTVAVEALLAEAPVLPVEELRNAARIARDRLDPVGVTMRFEERFEARSFRAWIDENGQHHARIAFDDDAAAWVHTMLRAALRPRRGPRFVTPGALEGDVIAPLDERSNEQLQYDTLISILRTGANADPNQAFGDRQPGVRIIVEASAIDDAEEDGKMRVTGAGHLEDGGASVPPGVVEKYLCDAGATTIRIDASGRPLDVGRESRLFTAKQRVAIAARDGGCIWPSCIAPPSECEYHHTAHWFEHHGRTDVDDGVPLCRNCHMRLHNQRWRIARERDPFTGLDTYWLHPPPDSGTGERAAPIELHSKSPRRFPAAS